MSHLWDGLCTAYRVLGFESVAKGDTVFRDLVLARIIEPTSKADAFRVLTEVGVDVASYATLKRRLPVYATPSLRQSLAAACARHASLGPASLVLFDVSTLYFETDTADGFREPGFSKERVRRGQGNSRIVLEAVMPEDAPPNGGAPTEQARIGPYQRVSEMQAKLHRWAAADAGRRFDDLFNFVYDPATLVVAFDRVATNRGARTAGSDGLTVTRIETEIGAPEFLDKLRTQLKSGQFRPQPVRERKIPKPGGSGKVRRLDIPTVADRVVQAALKLVLEPIFETGFDPVSYGFRPAGAHTMRSPRSICSAPRDTAGCLMQTSRHALTASTTPP